MNLQPRDEQILRCCYEQQFLLAEHVQKHFFSGSAAARKAYERIAELEQSGFLKRERRLTLDGKMIIRLSRQGLAYVRGNHPISIPYAKTVHQATLRHDAIVTSVSLRLRTFWDGVWVPERALKKDDYPQIPDGIFVALRGNEWVTFDWFCESRAV